MTTDIFRKSGQFDPKAKGELYVKTACPNCGRPVWSHWCVHCAKDIEVFS